jgi:hypothetical protein
LMRVKSSKFSVGLGEFRYPFDIITLYLNLQSKNRKVGI